MAYDVKGFQTLAPMGTPTGASGSRRMLHTYITNDAAAVVETSDYFLSLYQRLKVGDIILVSLDVDGSPSLRSYVFLTVGSGGVTVGRETTAVTGDQANIAALAGALTGAVDGTMEDVAATAAATAGGAAPSAAQVDAGIATAVASIVTGVNLQNKELQTKVNAILAMLATSELMTAP